MVRDIIQIGDTKLLKQSEKVIDVKSKKTQKLISELLETADQSGLNSVGLSAVQIGVLDRVFVAKRIDLAKGEEKWEVFVNPEIKIIDPSDSELWEGCLSIGVGPDQLYSPVTRANGVEVHYQDKNGKEQKFVAFDYMSHILQHEVDHLNGRLFLSYVKDPKNIWKSKELDKYLDKNGEYPPITNHD